jgi:hypothetical protein
VRRPLRALLGLRTVACKEDVASVIDCAGRTYGVDVASLADPSVAPAAAHDALSRLLAAALQDVAGIHTGPQSLRVKI